MKEHEETGTKPCERPWAHAYITFSRRHKTYDFILAYAGRFFSSNGEPPPWKSNWKKFLYFQEVEAYQLQDIQAAVPGDDTQTADYGSWKREVDDVTESMKISHDALQAYDVDVNDYPSLKKAETETQVVYSWI